MLDLIRFGLRHDPYAVIGVASLFALVFAFALVTPNDNERAMPSAPAVAASPSNPSVSPLRASIRIAGER